MRRPISRTLTVASLLVATFAVAVWVATAFVGVRWDYGTVDRSADPVEVATVRSFALTPHQVQLELTRLRMDRGRSLVTLDSIVPTGLSWMRSTPTPGMVGDAHRLVPSVGRRSPPFDGFDVRSTVALRVPIWPLVLAAGLLPAVRFTRWRKRRQWPATACRRCGYDRRGGSAGPCPECGTMTG